MLGNRIYDDHGREVGGVFSEPFEIESGTFFDGYLMYKTLSEVPQVPKRDEENSSLKRVIKYLPLLEY